MSANGLEDQLIQIEQIGISGPLLKALSRAARFHGHICPGLAMGVSASISFLNGRERSPDEELVAVVENDACGADGIQSLLGCTFGKGNLIFLDHGKSVYTFFDRMSGRGWRYSFQGIPQNEDDPEAMSLFSKVRSGEATPDEKNDFQIKWLKRAAMVLEMGEDLFTIREVKEEIPEKARIFESFVCPDCGEKVGAHRAVEINKERYCLPCSRKRS